MKWKDDLSNKDEARRLKETEEKNISGPRGPEKAIPCAVLNEPCLCVSVRSASLKVWC
jgi:hypothetical protein